MVFIDVPSLSKKETFIGDSLTSSYTLSESSPIDIHVLVSGIYLTEIEDYIISGNTINFLENPLLDENINIIYKT